MDLSVTIGLSVIALMFFGFAFLLDNKHAVFKVVSLIFSVLMIMVISNHLLGTQDYCEIVLANTTISGNFTSYDYNRVCFAYGRETALTTFKIVNYFFKILQWYIFVFIIYFMFDVMGFNLIDRIKRGFK